MAGLHRLTCQGERQITVLRFHKYRRWFYMYNSDNRNWRLYQSTVATYTSQTAYSCLKILIDFYYILCRSHFTTAWFLTMKRISIFKDIACLSIGSNGALRILIDDIYTCNIDFSLFQTQTCLYSLLYSLCVLYQQCEVFVKYNIAFTVPTQGGIQKQWSLSTTVFQGHKDD